MSASRYEQAHRYDGVPLQFDESDSTEEIALQTRDVEIIRDVWRYKFITSPQLTELFWPDSSERAAQMRLAKLSRAGYLERFRPYIGQGTLPWTYRIGPEGHQVLRRLNITDSRYKRREVFDYGHVLHEIQLNAWVLAYRDVVGADRFEWSGEQTYWPPKTAGGAPRSAPAHHELQDPTQRPVRPDAVLRIASAESDAIYTLLIEFDRTRRVDKNFDKFRRYDCFLTSWWDAADAGWSEAPFVVFVCQQAEQRHTFVATADRQLTGTYETAESSTLWPGRRRVLFALEQDAHKQRLEAWRSPGQPCGSASREDEIQRVHLPV